MNRMPRLVVVAFAVMFLILLGGGVWFYRTQERYLLDGVEENLESISNLKLAQIVQWRSERLAEAEEILDRKFTRDVITPWMVRPRDDVTTSILSWFRSRQRHYQYNDVMLVDVEGVPRLSLSGRTAPLHRETINAIRTALSERRCVLTDLHADPAEQAPHLEAILPLLSGNGQTPEPIGAIIQEIDARQFLYPLIHSWPTASRSAETLLVRRDHDAVLFLNDLRHRRDTALKLLLPLSQNEAPEVIAVLGKEGIVEGKDYRGIDVLSVLKVVPDSSWFMIAKIDKTEILEGWRSLSSVILVSILGLLAAVAAALGMTWQHYAKAHYRLLFQSEAALRKSEARYATTVMSIGDGVIATDAAGRVELLNPMAEALTGWRQQDAYGKPIQEVFQIVNQETRQSVANSVERLLQEGAMVGLADCTLLLAREGKEHPIECRGAPIRSDKGELTGVVLVFRDRSEELAFLNELRQSEDKYRNLYDEAPVGYVELDCEGRIDRVNRRILEMLGYTAEEMMGEPMWNFVVEKGRAEAVILAKLSGLQGPSEALERTYKRKDGTPIPVLIKDQVARNSEGRATRIRVTVHDITERKKMEEELRRSRDELELRVSERTAELERKNRELQEFAFVASHDLSEPLRKIQTLGSLLEVRNAERLDEESRDYVSRMTGAANRMQALLGALLRYSHVDAKGQDFRTQKLDDLVQDAVSDLEMTIRHIDAHVKIGPLPMVAGDPNQLRQLLENLITNSLKYRRSEVKPLVRVYGEEKDGVCRIFVEDNGIGFDEKYLEKIFQPFQRLHGRKEYPGIGMGLAICRKIVERHKGTITAKSTPGKGSTFVITLPLEEGETKPAQSTTSRALKNP